jgi:ABC-type protease/lipase transport system fused ATPase/permease subunit
MGSDNQERLRNAAAKDVAPCLKPSAGYETMLVIRPEAELSWGEWQKIAIARALYREVQADLDEPSSSLMQTLSTRSF